MRTKVTSLREGGSRDRSELLATEEPLEIRAGGPGQELVRVAVTMRTPGHDFELAAGFLVTEGVVEAADIATVAYCEDPGVQHFNVVTVRTRTPFQIGSAERNFFTTSSCGICGKAALEAIEVRCDRFPAGGHIDAATIVGLPDVLRARQKIFESTGGLHAAGLFDGNGRLIAVREDVGRHNAVDKIAGLVALGTALPLDPILLVSGRLSFELVQKAAVARIPVICAVSAPSSLAATAAEALGMTAIGFLRDETFNVYTHPERIRFAKAA
jgi:FdhD protein